MNIVVICGMSDDKVRANLLPLIDLKEIDVIYLVRRGPIKMPKVVDISPPAGIRTILIIAELYRLISLIILCLIKKIDILYGIYFIPHGIYAAIAGWLFRKPVIQELIGTDRMKVMRQPLLLQILKSADSIGVRGSTSREQLINVGVPEEKLFTPTGVNVLDFNHFKPENNQKIYDLIYCGRMDQNKQIDLLVRSIAVLKERHPELSAIFVGDGPERDNLETLTEKLGLKTTIVFVGNQPYEKIPVYLNQSRIFIMASAFEGLPVAMIEALSCGLPVIVPDVGDIPDIAIHGYNAYLVKQNEISNYVEALSAVLEDQELYGTLKQGALRTRKKFLRVYDFQTAKKKWVDILDKTVS